MGSLSDNQLKLDDEVADEILAGIDCENFPTKTSESSQSKIVFNNCSFHNVTFN